MRLSLAEATRRAAAALEQAGATPAMAASTAKALVLAQAQGISSHGLGRVAQYAAHLRNGRADGQAVATVVREHGAALLVDAGQGLAFPACELAVARGIATAQRLAVCFAGVTNSHHAGVLVDHLRPAAAAGLVGLGFTNSPAAMPAAGGRHAVFGTNPVAAVFPRRGADPLMVDLSLSEVARGADGNAGHGDAGGRGRAHCRRAKARTGAEGGIGGIGDSRRAAVTLVGSQRDPHPTQTGLAFVRWG